MLTSTSARRVAATWLAGCFVAIAAHSARGDVPKSLPLPEDPLREVFDRIGGHADTDAWQKPGWKDEQIEAWLDKIVTAIAKGAEMEGLALPVRQADVQPAVDGAFPPLREGLLIVGKDVNYSRSLRRSIVLAEGNAQLGSVEDCVVVARGSVSMKFCRRSVVVSGVCISAYFDGEPGGAASGSILVTPGWIDIRTTYGSVLVALQQPIIGRAQDTVFVNAAVPPARFVRNGDTTRSVKIADLPIQPLTLHALGEKLQLLGVVQGDPREDPLDRITSPAKGVVFRYEGRRYVADVGEPIADEAGQELAALAGWKLAAVTGEIAVFSNADTHAVARMAAN